MVDIDLQCERCKKTYKSIFDSVVRLDYAEPGKGKPYEFHLCIGCRRLLLSWFENKER